MKHCLACYRKIPHDASVCHYCGAPQAEKGNFPTKGIVRCPNCLSYLYSETSGCQKCGYVPVEKKKTVRFIVPIVALVLFSVFAGWQLGMIPFLPSAGKLSASFNIGEGTSVSEIISAVELVPLRSSQGANSLPTPTVFGESGAETDVESIESAELEPAFQLPEDSVQPEPTELPPALPTLPRINSQPGEAEISGASSESEPALTAESSDDEISTAETAEPTMTATPDLAFRCGNMRHQFETGMTGRLGSIGTSIKVRKEPKTTADQVSILRAGMTFRALAAEPVCDGNYMWMQIHMIEENVTGWTVEADSEFYWVVPLE